ncbi:MAG: hypothetical protein AAFO69_10525 [Bacteroidota bacterium]
MHISIKVLLTAILCVTAGLNLAIATGPPGPPATPIDGGLSLLLAGGVTYGIHKVRQASKKNR